MDQIEVNKIIKFYQGSGENEFEVHLSRAKTNSWLSLFKVRESVEGQRTWGYLRM